MPGPRWGRAARKVQTGLRSGLSYTQIHSQLRQSASELSWPVTARGVAICGAGRSTPGGEKVAVMSETQALQVETVTRGAVPEDAMDLAVLRVRAELRAAHEPVLFAKVKL